MAKTKACMKCKKIYEEAKCPNCNETAFSDTYKGQAYIFNPEKSVIGHNMKVNAKGKFAIKVR